MTDKIPYEPNYAEPDNVDSMRFWVRGELERISAALIDLAADSGGTTPTRNYQYATVNGNFPFQTNLTVLVTAPAIVSTGNPLKIEVFITCTQSLRVRIMRSIDGASSIPIIDIPALSTAAGNKAMPLDWVDTVPTSGQSVVYQVQVQAAAASTEQTDSLIWVEEA